MNTNTMELNQEEMEKASAGTIGGNVYEDHEYVNVGINCVHNLIFRDEFWWNGKDIGHDDANAVVYFCRNNNGRQPASVEEATAFQRAAHQRFLKKGADIRQVVN